MCGARAPEVNRSGLAAAPHPGLEMIQLQQKAKGERPRYFDDQAIDTVLSIALALAGEVAVLRDRMDTTERLTEMDVKPTRTAIEAYEPNAGVRAERDQWRDRFLDVVLRAVHQQREALEQAQPSYDDAVRAVETPPGEDTRDRVM